VAAAVISGNAIIALTIRPTRNPRHASMPPGGEPVARTSKPCAHRNTENQPHVRRENHVPNRNTRKIGNGGQLFAALDATDRYPQPDAEMFGKASMAHAFP
jgi:hypothetical protein